MKEMRIEFILGIISVIIFLASFVGGVVVVFNKIVFGYAAGWASIFISLWCVGGLMLLGIGVIGIYVSKIYIETKQRPYTIVKNVYENQESS